MESSKFSMYKTAGDIANLAMEKAIELCRQKMKASYICTFCDTLITEKLSKSYKKLEKGIMLPTCISVNSIVSHCTYSDKDDYEFNDGDIVRIELACHIDNNVASVGETIKIGDEDWNSSNIMMAALKAIQVGIQMIRPNVEVIEYNKHIEKVVKKFGYHLVKRPNSYHDDEVTIYYDWCHRDNGYFCEPSWVVRKDDELILFDEDEMSDDEYNKEQEFTKGEVYHISVTISDSEKLSFDSIKPKVFQRTQNKYNLKSKASRELLSHVNEKYGTSCWKISNLEIPESRARLALRECTDHGLIRGFGITELSKANIVLMKCTIIIHENSVYKLTGNKLSDPETH